MELPEMQGLPEVVYRLLVDKTKANDCELIWNIGGHGQQVELTLKWLPRGSHWEDPFIVTPQRHKSPGCRKRDNNRYKWYNVKRNSVAVSTELGDCDFDNSENEDNPVSAPLDTTGEPKNSTESSVNPAVDTTGHTSSQPEHSVEISHNNCVQQDNVHSHTDTSKQNHASIHNNEPNSISENTDNTSILNKDEYIFNTFAKAVNDPTTSTILAKSVDYRIYRYHYDQSRVGHACELLKDLSTRAPHGYLVCKCSKLS